MKKWVLFLILYYVVNCYCQTITANDNHRISNQQNLSEVINLYPLAVGNKWIYVDTVWFHSITDIYVRSVRVIGETIAPNGKAYFDLIYGDEHHLERVDSTDGKVYRYYVHPRLPQSEYPIAPLLAGVGDTINTFDPIFNTTWVIKVTGFDTFNNWGLTKFRKKYQQTSDSSNIFYVFGLTEDIGRDYYSTGIFASSYRVDSRLKGCVINGIVYGDTTFTVGVDDRKPISMDYRLEQNYPNPFNATTTIRYQIPALSFVSIKIYDVLGRLVSTLVDEEKPAGIYRLTWNAGNLPSGTYFYRINAGIFTDTGKMILMK